MDFEWDEEKNRINVSKHRINFELASKVFDDPLVRYFFDRIVDGEERWQAVGHAMGQFLVVVVHCYRYRNGSEVIRIISARAATSHERKRYEEQ